ncbi:hypothetical protein [Streptomyces sp. NPDC059649]|uniref:hypothetical protein n=1 Tax=Streptomyces sp. NPDC059649 TaxID=3346895 RepID=UPI0036765266
MSYPIPPDDAGESGAGSAAATRKPAAARTTEIGCGAARHGAYRRLVRLTDAGRVGLTGTFGVPADLLS